MKSQSNIMMVVAVLLSNINSFAQIKNAITETVHVSGNCGMCKKTIEEAGSSKRIAEVKWDDKALQATLVYNPEKTNADEILKRIALAGYDNEKYLTPDEVYAKLHVCCQYERTLNPAAKKNGSEMEVEESHARHAQVNLQESSLPQKESQLQAVVDRYFHLKDALVQSDAVVASAKAMELAATIKTVEMNQLSTEEHAVWMQVLKSLTTHVEGIAQSKDLSRQREAFALFSDEMYKLVKVSEHKTTIYYQHCPMFNDGKGADWLSKDSVIKNPYYGSKMLGCGSTTEKIESSANE
ncbi:DUF3347 domain-containing protein [Crocinitomicaceae bacterium CZZ-1]|uniref:DUF3347 domain-containing protein n=1 Tax=Taishania pollutisoli TaxID=2766479 RepID=A0A8J6PM94_9FLAO|nr:DUF3347 domain-containing protein [Taishania pollutisoli]MBC9813425.1 DUF3347 domain-containing protein [Taishania pollutisoli]